MLSYAAANLLHRQLRSWLTVLGIVIGIASIVALIAIAQGLNDQVNNQLKQFGSNTISITPGQLSSQVSFGSPTRPPTAGKLTLNDKARIERVPGTEIVSGQVQARVDASYHNSQATFNIYGIEPEIFTKVQTVEIEQGRFLVDNDRRAVVVGNRIANGTIFKEKIAVGSVLLIGSEKTPYRVVGTLKKGMFSAIDGLVMAPLEDVRTLAGESISPNELSEINVVVKDGFDVNQTASQIELELLASHKVKEDEKDFTIITSDYIMEQVGQITGLLTLFLGGIAGISLIVGGVGIANTMFMSVIERTKEIGTLKAVGASRHDILALFVIESAMIGLIGGVAGATLGAAVALAAGSFGAPVTITWELLAFACVFSLCVGIVSGWIPARRGANFDPIDALREE